MELTWSLFRREEIKEQQTRRRKKRRARNSSGSHGLAVATNLAREVIHGTMPIARGASRYNNPHSGQEGR